VIPLSAADPASEAATAWAFDEASQRGVDLVALHAWSDLSAVLPHVDETTISRDDGGEIMVERLSGWQEEFPDVKVWRKSSVTGPRAGCSRRRRAPRWSCSVAGGEAASAG
jgi:hypothetical protein